MNATLGLVADSLAAPDSSTFAMIDRVLATIGIPLGWFAATAAAVVGWINTLKALAPRWVASFWYPTVGLIVSFLYSWASLRSGWVTVIVATFSLWGVVWVGWTSAKAAATKLGARQP